MIKEYILILFFTISPMNEEPRYYEIINFLGEDKTCQLLDKDVSLYSVSSESFSVESQCIIHIKNYSQIVQGKIYDPYGKYKGKIENGKIYSPYGKYQGKITSDGKIYSPYGKYQGKIK